MQPLRSLLVSALVITAGVVPLRATAAEPAPILTNLGLAGGWESYTALRGGDAVFTVPEAEQGGRDLNRDGDANDVVVHVWEASSGSVHNLGVALSGVSGGPGMLVPLDGGGVAFAVPEAGQGGRDLNGDGDSTDSVVHRWTRGSGLLNLRQAVKFETVCCYSDKYELSAVPGGDIAFLAPDSVAVVWDHATGEVRKLGPARAVKGFGNGYVAVITNEARDEVDLNGDGDTKDGVAQVWRRTPELLNLRQAVFGLVPFGPRLALFVSEEAQQAADRNGDGDASDSVIAVWDPADPGAIQNLRLAEGKSGSNVVALERGHLAFRGYEAQQSADLNGDGDTADQVVHIYDPATKKATNLGHNATDFVALDGGGLAFESLDRYHLLAWSPTTNTTADVGLRNNGIAQALPGGRVVFGVSEFGAGKADLNGDGDMTDHWIAHIWDPPTKRLVSLERVGEGVALSGGGFAFGVWEPSEDFDADGNGNGNEPGRDVNGDGDGRDSVVHIWDGAETTNLRFTGQPIRSLEGNRYAAVVYESQVGHDLNGDGDAADPVVHIGTGGPSVPFSGGDPIPPDSGPPPSGGGGTPVGGGAGPDPQPGANPGPAGPGVNPPAPPGPPRRSGYWMVTRDGTAYAFGDAVVYGSASVGRAAAVDLEPTPSGNGYWIVDDSGRVFPFGDARPLGSAEARQLSSGERVTSLSATPSGAGYWLFTTRGRVLAFGDARHLGDLAGITLNGPVLDSIPTPSGDGYYMVGSDGGIFSFGDAAFRGSLGGLRLNAPVQSLVPDGDGSGYWLVASDGGIFAFDAGFRGSLGSQRLDGPVTGMVRFGDGYLMVGEDGGIFNFSSFPFHGSLGGRSPSTPVTAVAALD